jgi:hypothetical protein
MWRVYGVGVTSRAITEAADEIDHLRSQLADTYPQGEIVRLMQILVDRDANLDRLNLEVHQLRTANARLERDHADMNNHRRNIQAMGKSPIFCDATHPDSECAGWVWYCSLIVGHLGPHHCPGASW